MTSASWNHETKVRLNEKITANINDLESLARQVIRGSKSSDLHSQAAKNLSSQEPCINHSFDNLKRFDHVKSQLEIQQAAIERSLGTLDEVHDELRTIRR